MKLINATCVKYSDRVLPHVSTPCRLDIITPEKISRAFLGSGEGLGTRLFCLPLFMSWMLSKLSYAHTYCYLELSEHEEEIVF